MRHFTTLCLLLGSLLGTLGCSRREEPAPPAPVANTGSYKLDGQAATPHHIAVYEYPNRSGQGFDELQIQLVTPATAQSVSVNMMLSFVKNTGSPVSTYLFTGVTRITGLGDTTSPQTRSYRENRQFTLAATASGGYTGTFSCTSPSFGTTAASELTEGTFTDVHP